MDVDKLNKYIDKAKKLQVLLRTKEAELKDWEADLTAREKDLESKKVAFRATLEEYGETTAGR